MTEPKITRIAATLVIEHDPELDQDKIIEALPTLTGTGVLFERKPDTTDDQIRNQQIDPTTLCFTAYLVGIEVA